MGHLLREGRCGWVVLLLQELQSELNWFFCLQGHFELALVLVSFKVSDLDTLSVQFSFELLTDYGAKQQQNPFLVVDGDVLAP